MKKIFITTKYERYNQKFNQKKTDIKNGIELKLDLDQTRETPALK